MHSLKSMNSFIEINVTTLMLMLHIHFGCLLNWFVLPTVLKRVFYLQFSQFEKQQKAQSWLREWQSINRDWFSGREELRELFGLSVQAVYGSSTEIVSGAHTSFCIDAFTVWIPA